MSERGWKSEPSHFLPERGYVTFGICRSGGARGHPDDGAASPAGGAEIARAEIRDGVLGRVARSLDQKNRTKFLRTNNARKHLP